MHAYLVHSYMYARSNVTRKLCYSKDDRAMRAI